MTDLEIATLFEDMATRLQTVTARVDRLEKPLPEAPAEASAPVPARDLEKERQEAEEHERRRTELQRLKDEIDLENARLAKAQEDSLTARARHEQAARLAAEESATWDARREALRIEAEGLAQTRRLLVKIWPGFLLGEAFAAWKDRLETALLLDQTPAAPALLFANLHGYTACLLESDLKYLRDVLRDISRFLYVWLKEEGHGEHAACEIAQQWASAFNAECAGKCEIEVPEPGTPANNQWMTFPPRGGAPDVITVKTWCVKDAAKRVIHRAEVFTS